MVYSVDSLEGRARLVRSAWAAKHELAPDNNLWICEVFSDYVVVEKEGKLFRVAYALDGTVVAFGDAEEVKVEYAEVSEPVAVEAFQPVGKKWEVRVIREGVSGHGWIYTQKALESLIPYLEGAKIRAVKTVSGVFGHDGTVVGEIGILRNAHAVEADGFYEPRAEAEINDDRREWLLKAMASGEVNGVSIHAPCVAARFKNGLVWVKKFTGFNSLDLATVPSAGGVFLRATEAMEGEVMNKEKILELLKKRRPDLYAKLAADCTLEQAQEALESALGNGESRRANGEAITAQEAAELRAMVEQGKKDSSAAYLTLKLSESKLPEPVRKKIEKHFAGSVFAREALDNFISAEKEMLDQLAQSGHVLGAGDTRIEVSREAVDKIQIALDRTFGVKVVGNEDVKAFRGLKHAYVQITGDSEVTGRLPERMVAREAIAAADFPKLLDRTLNRRVVQDYMEPNYHEDRLISSRGSATDFKTQESLRVGYYGNPPIVDPETADFLEAAKPGEESITYKVQTRGNLITVTRVAVINDDLGAIIKRIKGRGRAFRRGFAQFAWNFWINNSTYDGDATAWFTSGHGNLTSVAISAAEVFTHVLKLMDMKEPNSAEKLGLDPAQMRRCSLVVPHALYDDAVKINQAQYLDSNFTPNPVYKFFGDNNERVLAVPLLTDATDWGVLVDPSERGLIEVKFLNGQETPEMFLADQPTVGEMFKGDKLQFKDRFEYGGDIEDFRGAVKAEVA